MKPLQKAAVAFILGTSLTSACPLSFGQTADQHDATAPSPRPNPDASGIYHAGDGVTPPRVGHSVNARFTKDARRQKMSGTCVLSLIVGVDGLPHDIQIIKSIADTQPPELRSIAQGLDAKAVESIEKWSFKPATFEGKPVPVEIRVEVKFQTF